MRRRPVRIGRATKYRRWVHSAASSPPFQPAEESISDGQNRNCRRHNGVISPGRILGIQPARRAEAIYGRDVAACGF